MLKTVILAGRGSGLVLAVSLIELLRLSLAEEVLLCTWILGQSQLLQWNHQESNRDEK
jgi:hypothetical protein